MRVALAVLLIFVFCGSAVSQDLPPDILADQYLVEGIDALDNEDWEKAIKAFRKIEALDIEPPVMFPFYYGKALFENSTVLDDLLKGQLLLKRFVTNTDRGSKHSKHSTVALQLLADVEQKLLFTAIDEGQTEVVQALIVAGADVSVLDNGDGKRAIKAFRKIEALDTEPPVMFPFYYGKALVENSTVLDDLLKGQLLLKRFVINAERGSKHYTAALKLLSEVEGKFLYYAAVEGQTEAVQTFIAAGSDVNAGALRGAAEKGHAEVVQVLIAAGADVNAGALRGAAWSGHAEVVQVLIAAGANVNAGALHNAAWSGHAEVVQVLIAAGADVNAKDGYSVTPLHRAAGSGHAEIAQVLIAAGADVNARDGYSATPLHDAAGSGHAEVTQVLIAAGAYVNAVDKGYRTPLAVANREEHTEIEQVLEAAGANWAN